MSRRGQRGHPTHEGADRSVEAKPAEAPPTGVSNSGSGQTSPERKRPGNTCFQKATRLAMGLDTPGH